MQYNKNIILLSLLCVLLNNLSAQVPVIQEPHHRPVLVNDYIRLLDVHINAGDTTLYHVHAAPSVIIILSNSVIGMQKMNEAPSTANKVIAGATSFVNYETNPITHRVFNAGNNVFHVMDIEIVRKKSSQDSSSALKQSGIETVVNENTVRTYKFNVSAHQSLNINESNAAHLLVCVDGEISSFKKTIKAGEYIFFSPKTDVSITNKQNDIADCVLLELK